MTAAAGSTVLAAGRAEVIATWSTASTRAAGGVERFGESVARPGGIIAATTTMPGGTAVRTAATRATNGGTPGGIGAMSSAGTIAESIARTAAMRATSGGMRGGTVAATAGVLRA